MPKLCVNVDHVATLRQARMIDRPDPVEAALIAEKAGAVGITVHLREDRRHIQDHDVKRLKKVISTRLNFEMAPVDQIIPIAHKIKPYQVMFVPERRQEITTEGGLDVTRGRKRLKRIIEDFQHRHIKVSLFIDPEPEQIKASADLGPDIIEFNTGAYSEAKTKRDFNARLKKIYAAVEYAETKSFLINAGHGLTTQNVGPIAAIPAIEELHIGHGIVCRAVIVGFHQAVKEILGAIKDGASKRS